MKNPYATLSLGRVFKRPFFYTLNTSKVIFVTFNLNCQLHTASVGKPSAWMSSI